MKLIARLIGLVSALISALGALIVASLAGFGGHKTDFVDYALMFLWAIGAFAPPLILGLHLFWFRWRTPASGDY